MLPVCYVLLYVVALCVKMRHVILSIKRLLIDATNLLGDAEVLEFESEPAGGRQSSDGCDEAVEHALFSTESRIGGPLAQSRVRARHQTDLMNHSNPRLQRLYIA